MHEGGNEYGFNEAVVSKVKVRGSAEAADHSTLQVAHRFATLE